MPEPPQTGGGWSALAISGFVVSFIPFIGLVVGVPLSIAGVRATRGHRRKGRGLAIAGIVIGVVITGLIVAALVFVESQKAERDSSGTITKAGNIDFDQIRTKDCLDINGLQSGGQIKVGFGDLKGVPCSQSHNAQAYALINVGQGAYNESMVTGKAGQCVQQFSSNVSVQTGYLPFSLYPTESLWNDNKDNNIVCLVVRRDYQDFSQDLVK